MAATLSEEGSQVGGSHDDIEEDREMPGESKQLKEINPQDVEAVTEKLKEWVPTLPEQEQLVMGWVLTRAAAAGDEEVSEYAERSAGGPGVHAHGRSRRASGGFRPRAADQDDRSRADLDVPLVTITVATASH